MTGLFSNKKLILASQSPRRQELLKMICPEFRIRTDKTVKEVYPDDLASENVAAFLSELKFKAYQTELANDELLITSDTVVLLHGKIIGKPADLDDAVNILENLSANTHQVITGVSIGTSDQMKTFSEKTDVEFDKLSKEEIEYYVSNFSPLDKAGAYGIQEWIGAVGVKKITGSFYNVMGLPVHRLYRELTDFSAQVR